MVTTGGVVGSVARLFRTAATTASDDSPVMVAARRAVETQQPGYYDGWIPPAAKETRCKRYKMEGGG
jgi:hypothetical protein